MTMGIDANIPAQDSGSTERALLQIWFSPAFPIGGFAYSQGLEKAVEHGLVRGEETLAAWIADLFQFGSLRNDLIFTACAWRATVAQDLVSVTNVAELAIALQPSAERYMEAITQGACFLKAICESWPNPALVQVLESFGDKSAIPYAVGAGLVSGAYCLRLGATLESYALSFASAQISAGIRLGVIGQTAGQRILAELLPRVMEISAQAAQATLEDAGSSSFSADLCSLEHETQHTRLFRT